MLLHTQIIMYEMQSPKLSTISGPRGNPLSIFYVSYAVLNVILSLFKELCDVLNPCNIVT